MWSIPRLRYLGVALGVIFLFHLLASISPSYRDRIGFLPSGQKSADPAKLASGSHLASGPQDSTVAPVPNSEDLRAAKDSAEIKNRRKARAAFVILARNSDLAGVLDSVKQMEDRFNYWAKYDYVFLNDDEFDDTFKELTQNIIGPGSKALYGQIDHDHWNQPKWIDEERAKAGREEMIRNQVIYGFSVPYRNMCRFNSGFFFRHKLLADYDYYWRVEPNVKFFCDLAYDPFLSMMDNGYKYGWTLSLYEYELTIPTLWAETKKFIQDHPEYVHKNNAMPWISDNGGETYNLCHFWSNFEIGDLNFWRGEAYTAYFEHLEKAGGFYYERWGDAPVHSIAAALFLDKSEIHWFQDIGYRHEPFQHCPQGEYHTRGKCTCDPADNFDFEGYSCTARWVDFMSK
ncbi:hypothetical protein CspeluHIS016_0308150 [Cutaneotrichosporon spelunceum]|uniref:Glycosyltransferase family 15 protein n=1 Tax=Cutaneotrichosporon spelunceum TaxID=1672016 RepID=A0AAD3YBE8_9TREE|nr:hypothetical protein CspeluHIS016_0308150 [Cutaneotrichosporon spelunceum]